VKRRRRAAADLDGEWNDFKTNNSASFELLWVFQIAHDDADMIVEITALLGAALSGEAHGVSPGDKAEFIVSDCHRKAIEKPMHTIFLINHLLKDLHVALLIFFATQHHTRLVLFHSQL
jgi:hypothetical protein